MMMSQGSSGSLVSDESAGRAGERFARLHVGNLDEEGRRLRGAILGPPRSGRVGGIAIEAADGSLEGPFGIFLFSPAIGAALNELGSRLRDRSTLSARHRELAILAVAGALGSAFEAEVHRVAAMAAGVSDREAEAALEGRGLENAIDEALVGFCSAAARAPHPEAEFDRLAGSFGPRELVEIVALVGYYRTLASLMELFQISPPRN